MKAFELYDFSCPEEMKLMIRFFQDVQTKGKLNVDYAKLEELYEEFSNERCAMWLEVTDERLEAFLEWLRDEDIEE